MKTGIKWNTNFSLILIMFLLFFRYGQLSGMVEPIFGVLGSLVVVVRFHLKKDSIVLLYDIKVS